VKILIALNSFKDSIKAHDACLAIKTAIQENHPRWKVNLAPLTDGGDGFCEIFTELASGELKYADIHGPNFENQKAHWGLVETENLNQEVLNLLKLEETSKRVAIIEMAQASGLHSLCTQERNPWKTTTYGTGELLKKAKEADVSAIILGVGGSATNDLGVGALQALGLGVFSGNAKSIVPAFPQDWTDHVILRQGCAKMPPIKIACDVENPLLGENGATQTYGPQKGLDPDGVLEMEKLVESMANELCAFFKKPKSLMNLAGVGASGGLPFGLAVGCNAEILPGFKLVDAWLELESKVKIADYIITGEGKFDLTSFQGKGPGALLSLAKKENKKVIILAGIVTQDAKKKLNKDYPNAQIYSINPEEFTLSESLYKAKELLIKKIKEVLV